VTGFATPFTLGTLGWISTKKIKMDIILQANGQPTYFIIANKKENNYNFSRAKALWIQQVKKWCINNKQIIY
jgi:hypothetical protein